MEAMLKQNVQNKIETTSHHSYSVMVKEILITLSLASAACTSPRTAGQTGAGTCTTSAGCAAWADILISVSSLVQNLWPRQGWYLCGMGHSQATLDMQLLQIPVMRSVDLNK